MQIDRTPEMVAQILAGDAGAYEAFVRGTWPEAVRTCWLVLHRREDAEEAAQDALVQVYRRRRQLRDPSAFRAWFHRILVNAARQRLRGSDRRATVALEACDVWEPTGDADLRVTVRSALHRLPPGERLAVVLCHFCGLTDREGAVAAGWPLGSYKWRLAAARRRLAGWLGPDRLPAAGAAGRRA